MLLVPVNLTDGLSVVPHDAGSFHSLPQWPIEKLPEAQPHTPVYKMHKYFARRPWNVFSQLVSHYSSPGDVVLDPFCGGGTTVIESLKLKRRVVGVDINPLATYVTQMEARPIDLEAFKQAFKQICEIAEKKIRPLYLTKCRRCGATATLQWTEWSEEIGQMVRLKYGCPRCGLREDPPTIMDLKLSKGISTRFSAQARKTKLWFPKTQIPRGDKTDSLLARKINHFSELFTKRNLLALSILLKAIDGVSNEDAREFLRFAFSGTLKWASRQSHMRGEIVEGWAMHAYWIYPRSLEINIWRTFEKRVLAVLKGKQYLSSHTELPYRLTHNYEDLVNYKVSCMILQRSASKLPIPNESVDCIITDPPYGGNINYTELSDYWCVWLDRGHTINKSEEVIINRTQGKTLADYERMLFEVLRECYRVLKTNRHLVCTFNSKDMRVVTCFIAAVTRAGFVLEPEGLLYQKPIQAYATTVHAMQIGAFVGDFIFTFTKQINIQRAEIRPAHELQKVNDDVSTLITKAIGSGIAEVDLREKAYRILIPFVAKYANSDLRACIEAVDSFEEQMEKNLSHFRDMRIRLTHARRQHFRAEKHIDHPCHEDKVTMDSPLSCR